MSKLNQPPSPKKPEDQKTMADIIVNEEFHDYYEATQKRRHYKARIYQNRSLSTEASKFDEQPRIKKEEVKTGKVKIEEGH